MANCSLGCDTYSKLKQILEQQGHDILSPWIHIKAEQSKISPKPQPLPVPHEGVMLTYVESVSFTAQRIMEDMPISLIPNPAIMDIQFGFDGSGNYAIYQKINNEKTNNIIMTMFCPLALKSEAKWSQQSPSSDLTHCPLALQLGRESSKSLQSLTLFDDDISKLKSFGYKVKVGDLEIPLKVNVASLMMDMKAAKIYLGLGGAYCDLCETSIEDLPRYRYCR